MVNDSDIFEFMNSQPLMVLSSLNNKLKPQSAVIGFGQTKDLKLIFGTSEENRKALNISLNNNVSAVIGWKDITVQYEGEARILSKSEEDEYLDIYYTKNEKALKYKDEPHERHFIIFPKWIRYTDTKTTPWTICEFNC